MSDDRGAAIPCNNDKCPDTDEHFMGAPGCMYDDDPLQLDPEYEDE